MHDGNNPLVNSTRFQSLLTFTKIGWSSKKLNTVEQKGFKLMYINILCLVFFFANVQTPGFLIRKNSVNDYQLPDSSVLEIVERMKLAWALNLSKNKGTMSGSQIFSLSSRVI